MIGVAASAKMCLDAVPLDCVKIEELLSAGYCNDVSYM